MPNFVIEYGEWLTQQIAPDIPMDMVFKGAEVNDHFTHEAIKNRIEPLKTLDLSSVFVSVEIVDIHSASFVNFVY
jgi:5-carboxymethyl-2-hydroxymuconate isomerase